MIVEPMRNQYRLIGNPLSFFAAQQLELKSAPAETGTKEEIQVRNSFEQKELSYGATNRQTLEK